MTKSDIAAILCDRVGAFSKKEATDIVDSTLETIKRSLECGESVKISGFGNFELRAKKPRPGRNPQTGKELTIEARNVLVFRPSPMLRSLLSDEDEF